MKRFILRNSTSRSFTIVIDDMTIPINAISERRHSLRAALGASAVLVRVPFMSDTVFEKTVIPWLTNWLNRVQQKQNTLLRYALRPYTTDHHWQSIFGRYHIQFDETNKPHLVKQKIIVPIEWQAVQSLEEKLLQEKQVAKLFGSRHIDDFRLLVREINEETLQVDYTKLSLRYNRSRWGSCSTSGTITLNSKLLLAPKWIMRSVVIHELTHRKFPDHSKSFWHLVRQHDPDQSEAIRWLKINGSNLRY